MKPEFWENKNILITGAAGFKGSHLVEQLSKTNARIISLVREFDPKSYFQVKELGKKSVVVIGDLKNPVKMADILSQFEITSIFHLGAQPLVTTALMNPSETLNSNIMGTVNILEAARVYGKVDEILIVSSDKAYGPSENVPYKENERLHGKAPYDVSKSCMDLISQMYGRVYNLPIVITRCANVFGPGDSNMNRIVPDTMRAIIKNKTLEIRSDGKMIREYIYVKDTADAYISLLENINKTKGHAFNITSNNLMSVLDVVKRISIILNKPIKTKILNQAKTEISKQYLEGSKIKQMIGWETKTSFEQAVLQTYDWYQEIIK